MIQCQGCDSLYLNVIDEIDFWDQRFILPEYDYIQRVLEKFEGIHVPLALYHYFRHSKSLTADREMMERAKEQTKCDHKIGGLRSGARRRRVYSSNHVRDLEGKSSQAL